MSSSQMAGRVAAPAPSSAASKERRYTNTEAGSPARDDSRRGLVWQLAGIAAAVAVLLFWLSATDLTQTELATLAPATLWVYIAEHLRLTLFSAVIVLVVALPLGVLLTRKPLRFLTGPVLAVVNVGQAAPAIGLVVLLAFWLGFGFWTAVVALVLYALLPVLRNTMVGLDSVDPRLVEAGRGMGMSASRVLFRVELPLAVPLMLAGIRTALVLLVGTAALATFINGGGLGVLITTGVNLNLPRVLISGAVMVALLALLVDWVGRLVEHLARPKGL
ncbi:ABC transporter permease [Arthrobacter sp. zg-Y820]|uniref:ABC transporter permease n=1 Tax=unclassified Arthrobacter TaxID=235627 RepID=UPI001E5A407F|nr:MULTISPECIES: ABC transporter permease [unclassified Arthrobacter]MCC9195465.1 ABC transporter permease [Arthrobacter sp. zg-Y820]MDK1278324.1 ABC transporter permease [Arthrobacter sp. zg.Y820]WIB10203.1 ABC transporter permease [Arthrobacter sp. zg-Y820]